MEFLILARSKVVAEKEGISTQMEELLP